MWRRDGPRSVGGVMAGGPSAFGERRRTPLAMMARRLNRPLDPRLERSGLDGKRSRCSAHALIVGRELDGLAAGAQKLDRRQVQGIEGAHGHRKRLDRTREHGGRQFDQGQTSDQLSRMLAVCWQELAGMDAGPHFVFEQPAGDELALPERLRRRTVLRQQVGQRHRAIDLDHRSSRSWSSSLIRSRNFMTGLRGGAPAPTRVGGVTQPRRTASASMASARKAPLPGCGGTISATTRSRSVTSTVSPLAASRMYSLSLFFSILRPMARMISKVATRSYLVNSRPPAKARGVALYPSITARADKVIE